MDNTIIKQIENDPQVKELKEQLKQIEDKYFQEAEDKAKREKQQYKEWYAALSEEEKLTEDIRKSKEKISEMKKKKQQLSRSKKQSDERTRRNHLLIMLGAEILSLCGKNGITITEEMVSAVAGALSYEYKSSNENIFIANLKKELKNRTGITLTPVSFDLEDSYDKQN